MKLEMQRKLLKKFDLYRKINGDDAQIAFLEVMREVFLEVNVEKFISNEELSFLQSDLLNDELNNMSKELCNFIMKDPSLRHFESKKTQNGLEIKTNLTVLKMR